MPDKLAKSVFLACECAAIEKTAETRWKAYARLFGRFVKLWGKRFERQADEWEAYLENNPQMFIGIRKDAEDDFETDLEEQMAEAYRLGMEWQDAAVKEQLAVGLSFDIRDEDALAWARTKVGELIKGVDATTAEDIRKIVEDALKERKTMGEVKEAIREKFLQYSAYRSSLIAVMELGNSYEQGKKAQFSRYADRFGVDGFKRSFTQGDSNVRPTHKQNADAGWIPASRLFPGTNTDTAPHGFNCRCNVQWSLWDQWKESPDYLK